MLIGRRIRSSCEGEVSYYWPAGWRAIGCGLRLGLHPDLNDRYAIKYTAVFSKSAIQTVFKPSLALGTLQLVVPTVRDSTSQNDDSSYALAIQHGTLTGRNRGPNGSRFENMLCQLFSCPASSLTSQREVERPSQFLFCAARHLEKQQ
jgi:hypothetical protein